MPTWLDLLKASALGLIEGLTQFLPVSASAHALLGQRFLGLGPQSAGFALAVKLAALLALLWVYRARLRQLAAGGGRFALGIAAALMPAALIAVLARTAIENARLNVWVVCLALILGGALLRLADAPERKPSLHDATALPLSVYAIIGIGLCTALIPGVSGGAAIIIAAMLLGVDRRAAADLSLWLAIPSLLGIIAYELVQDGGRMGGESALALGLGFAFSFLAALLAASAFVAQVETLPHLDPPDHPAFYSANRLTLSVSRQAMLEWGYTPSGRLFEATCCGTPLLSDPFPGLESFFTKGEEILVAHTTEDAVSALELSDAELARIGAAGRQRTFQEHTGTARARQLVAACKAVPC